MTKNILQLSCVVVKGIGEFFRKQGWQLEFFQRQLFRRTVLKIYFHNWIAYQNHLIFKVLNTKINSKILTFEHINLLLHSILMKHNLNIWKWHSYLNLPKVHAQFFVLININIFDNIKCKSFVIYQNSFLKTRNLDIDTRDFQITISQWDYTQSCLLARFFWDYQLAYEGRKDERDM